MATKPRTFNYNFREQFAAKIEAGEKLQTIRLERRDRQRPQIGDRVQLYCGLRTKNCRRLAAGAVVECISIVLELGEASTRALWANGVKLSPIEAETFARSDGFVDAIGMRQFFRNQYRGMPEFRGYCVRWRLDRVDG